MVMPSRAASRVAACTARSSCGSSATGAAAVESPPRIGMRQAASASRQRYFMPPAKRPGCCGRVGETAHVFATSRRLPWIRMRVLIAEDELYLAEALQTGLRREAIAADIALDGDAALERLAITDYDVLVLDRDLPGTHGDQVAETVAREHPEVRILMLTAAARLRDKL